MFMAMGASIVELLIRLTLGQKTTDLSLISYGKEEEGRKILLQLLSKKHQQSVNDS